MIRIICGGGIDLVVLVAGGKNHLHEPRSFPALQPVMLIIQVLVALFLFIGDLSVPSTFFHNLLGTEKCILVVVVSVDPVLILDQMAVFDVLPATTIPDARDVPGSVVNQHGLGYSQSEIVRLWASQIPYERDM